MKFDNIIKLIQELTKQLVSVIDCNNKLMIENLRLMKEVDALNKKSNGN